MITKAGCNIVHISELPWEKNTHHRAKTYWHDAENNLTLQWVDQSVNAIGANHAPGIHTAMMLKGRARVDGLILSPLDAILHSGNEPQVSLEYPDGCQWLRCFQGNNNPANAPSTSSEKHYRLIRSEQIAWDAKAGGALHMKTLVDRGAGRLMLTAMRLSAGFTVPIGSRPHMQAALIVEGSAVIDGETLTAWDFMYMAAGVPHGPISFPDGATLLMVAMRPVQA